MKTLTVVGARPQFIKAAMLSPLLNDVLVHTGQHYDYEMSAAFFKDMDIPEPAYNLNIGSFNHGKQTGLMMAAVEEVMQLEKPDIVIVYGDTNSTLAGALVAAKLKIPVAHVEAGLRSYNQIPEEINRRLTDHVSEYLFMPTMGAFKNLLREGIEQSKMYLVGDIMFDAFRKYSGSVREGDYILATIHRAENTDNHERLHSIFAALDKLGNVICPLHPRVKLKDEYKNITFTSPVNYSEMLRLEKGARAIVTDSGGVQKEAYFARKPCITVRPVTEWPELVEAGWNKLVEPHQIYDAVKTAYPEGEFVDYGDGSTATKIAEVLNKAKVGR